MSRRLPEDPRKVCEKQFSNTTIQYHECLCEYNYTTKDRRLGVMKFKSCALADELRKEVNFNMYQIIGFSVLVFFIASIILFLSFKWYQKTKKNPCACLFSCCCSSEEEKKDRQAHCNGAGVDTHDSNAGFDDNWVHEMNVDVGSFHQHNGMTNGYGPDSYQHHNGKETRKKTFCMNFCLSEPVQDCCEFFDCDLLWRKKTIYSQPYFGRPRRTDSVQGELNGAYALKGGPPSQFSAAGGPHHLQHQQEPSTLQRRPTRPAPPPPQLPGAPGSALHNVPVFDDGSHIVDDDIVCEPIPEAPPSPEPVRKTQPDQPRSIYVDPLAFLQRPFLRLSIALSGRDASQRDSKADGGEGEDSEALYSRVKDYVLSRVHRGKSGSVLSLNRGSGGGVSNHPDGGAESPSKSKANYRKGGSLASLHNIAEATLGKTYGGSKHSISVASLNMLDDTMHTHLGPSGNASRLGSRQDLADEDVPPNNRDEYIDLEEMARKMAARAAQQQQQQHGSEAGSDVRSVVTSQPLSVQSLPRAVEHPHDTSSSYPSSQTSPTGSSRTPDFIPASAYTVPQPSSGRSTQPPGAAFEIGPSVLYPNQGSQSPSQTVPTVSNTIFTSSSDQLDATPTSSAFSQANYTSFQRDPTVQQSQQSSVVPTVRDGKPTVASRPDRATVPTPSPPVTGSVVPYTGPAHATPSSSSTTSPYVPLSQVMSNGTLGRSKPSVPPRPSALNENPNYRSLGRPTIAPPSPKILDPRAAALAAAAAAASLPHSPLLGAGRPTMVPPMTPLMLHEQQMLLQQQLYLQQNPHLNPAMQQLILQQQLQHEHTIMTPAVQQQLLQEQQMYQQMLQHQQHYQLQQQYQHHLQQQLLQQQLHHGMRYRQPLSSTSSTNSSTSSKSSRSIHKPNHPPPPPPSHVPPPHPSSSSSVGGAPIESSI